MEEAYVLERYLPLSFNSLKEQEYVAFLWDAFETNYTHGKYQFAFLAYHMLTMSFIYFNIWQIKQAEPSDFAKGLIGFGKDVEKNLLEATSPYVFSTVNERAILRFLKLITCDNCQIGTYAKLVDDRNDTAHSNGNIFYSTESALEDKINEILRVVDEIQTHSKPVIETIYREFLLSSYDPDEREYPDDADQIREILIHGNYFSQQDIDVCLNFDPAPLHQHPRFDAIISLHRGLWDTYAPWDGDQLFQIAARRAVERKLAKAYWDEAEKVICLDDTDGLSGYITISSKEELEEYLRGVALAGFQAYMPQGNEYECECEDGEIVLSVLSQYNEQLRGLFSD